MEKFIEQVNDIYLILSALTVSGDAVDIVAALRSKLRDLYNQMKATAGADEKKEAVDNGGQNDR